jgi:hypothetical protein
MIGSPTLWAAAGICSALGLLLLLFQSQHRVEQLSSLPIYVLVVGLLALVVFPLAAAPLALAWNRHR